MPSETVPQIDERWHRQASMRRLPTGRAAFVGRTLRGPVNRAVALTSFTEFQAEFGGLWQPSPLGYALEQFFDNGGREAYVVRVANGARPATLTLPAGDGDALVLHAARPGTREFLRACVDYDQVCADEVASFNLTVQRVRAQGSAHVEDQEIFAGVSVRPGDSRHLAHVLARSELIRSIAPAPPVRPHRTVDAASGLATGWIGSNADGDDGAPLSDYDLIGSAVERTGLHALDAALHFDFLYLPPIARDRDLGVSALVVAARFCHERRALLIVDPPSAWHTADDALRALQDWGFTSEDALMYFPRILAYDKLRGRFDTFASGGAVAGLLARRDAQLQVWEERADAPDPVLRPGYKAVCQITEAQRAKLWGFGVNVLQSVRSATRRPLRARTLAAGSAADFLYLAPRRAAQYIVNCVVHGTRWSAELAPEPHVLRAVEEQVREFLSDLHRGGAFAGRSLEDAFFVICDRRVNAQATDADQGLNLLMGFAASRPGEFHSYRIHHGPGGSAARAVTLNRLHDLRFSPEQIEWAERLASRLEA
ncbi:MAG: phage tail sheath family protein [Steroidobacteraceae bacterium]|nr:phage tail sheath family protein [Steroidobacteraceae bacterium]